MRAYWDRLDARFHALARRERIVIFAGSVAGVLLLGYQFLIDPHVMRQASMARNLAQQQQALAELRSAVAAGASRPQDPDAQNRAALQQLLKRVAEAEAEYRRVQAKLVPSDQMATLLETMLSRNRGLRLVSLTTLSTSPVLGKPPARAGDDRKPAPDSAPPPDTGGLFKHGVQITVRGGYPELLEYLTQLEKLPQKMYWGRVALATEEYPVSVMQLTIYTISVGKSWLVI